MSMDATAAPPREEVRSHKVNRVSQEPENSINHSKHEPEQGKQSPRGNDQTDAKVQPSLTLRGDGTVLFKYSVENDTSYVRKKPSLQSGSVRKDDPDLCGYTLREWERLLSAHRPVADALRMSDNGERKEILDNLVKERFLRDLRDSGVHADLLNVNGCSRYMSAWEQTAVCALLTIPNLRLCDEAGADLGRGPYRLGPEFDHVSFAVIPPHDTDSPYRQRFARQFAGQNNMHFLVVYQGVRSEEELLALRNVMFSAVNRNKPFDFNYQDDKSAQNRNGKFLRIRGNEADKNGAEYRRTCAITFIPSPAPENHPPAVLEDYGVVQASLAIQKWIMSRDHRFPDQDILIDFVPPVFPDTPREGKGKGKGKGRGKGKGKGKGMRTFTSSLPPKSSTPRHSQICMMTVPALRTVAEFVSRIPDKHVLTLFVGGHYGVTIASEPFEGCYPIKIVACKTVFTATEAWQQHQADRRRKIDNFLRLLPAPVSEPMPPAAGPEPMYSAPTIMMGSSEFDSPVKGWGDEDLPSQNAIGKCVADLLLFLEPCNGLHVPVELVVQFLLAKGCKMPDIRQWVQASRATYLSSAQRSMTDVTLASILSRFMVSNPFGAPFGDLADAESDATRVFGIFFPDDGSRDIALSSSAELEAMGYCRVVSFDAAPYSVITSGTAFPVTQGAPSAYITALRSVGTSDYWKYLKQGTVIRYQRLWSDTRGAVLNIHPGYARKVLGLTEPHLSILNQAETADIVSTAAELVEQADGDSKADRKKDRKLRAAQEAKMRSMEIQRQALLRKQLEQDIAAKPVPSAVKRQAREQFEADRQALAAHEALLRQKQASALVSQMHDLTKAPAADTKRDKEEALKRRMRKQREADRRARAEYESNRARQVADAISLSSSDSGSEEDDSENNMEDESAAPSATKVQKRGGKIKKKPKKDKKKKKKKKRDRSRDRDGENEEKDDDASKRQNDGKVSPFEPFLVNRTHKTSETCMHALSTRLAMANSVLPYLHLCHRRRATGRRTKGRVGHQRLLRVTVAGGAVRAAPPESQEQRRIARNWRVSKAYIRNYIGNSRMNMHTSSPYISSRLQTERVYYCLRVRTALGIQWIKRVGPPYSSTFSCSPTGERGAQCDPPPRGRRAGCPAGPGLPHGDSTGDDD